MSPASSLRESGAALVAGTLVVEALLALGAWWSFQLANPVGLVPAYFAAGLLGPYVAVALQRRRGVRATFAAAFLPMVAGVLLFSAYFGVQFTQTTELEQVGAAAFAVLPLVLLPVGAGLAFLARWFALRGARPAEPA